MSQFKPRFSPEARSEIKEIIGFDDCELDGTLRLIENDLEVLLLAEHEERAKGERKRKMRRFFVSVLAGRMQQYGVNPSAARNADSVSPFTRIVNLAFESAGICNTDPYRVIADAINGLNSPRLDTLTDAERRIAVAEIQQQKDVATKNRLARRYRK